MYMGKPNRRIEQALTALCDELDWGLRCFYAARAAAHIPGAPVLAETFQGACADQSLLTLARIVLAKKNARRDESINIRYLANLVKGKPSAVCFGDAEEVEALIEKQARLQEEHAPLIATLKEQRDRSLAHLDRHHVNGPSWRQSQSGVNMAQVEALYQGLAEILGEYHRLIFGAERRFDQWKKSP